MSRRQGSAAVRQRNGRAQAPSVALPPVAATAPLRIAAGTLEAMKWLGVVLMTLDHVNKFLLHYQYPALYALGRVAMPLFVFVLCYNLARPQALEGGALHRVARRLALFGAAASVPFIGLGQVIGGWWPLNILFTLLVATLVIGLLSHRSQLHTVAAVALFVIGGALVEYWWFALAFAIACWLYCRQPDRLRLCVLLACCGALWWANRNMWHLAALPLILAAPHVEFKLPRAGRLFYWYYPAHLGVLWLVARTG
ncbi:TraX family protein [Pseudoduganella chitinolytica]|uniref:TraX family protein n=1 Tax=Pseudoduganella chitinolytica TaxID=34070 RepID=A0ABY8B698_9BURK|nr:TraX family protein [Pseudoduganella chitinolytica]WEF31457.1 TraX family protein [Pseudoduganella chitinolytica]